jgi:four helix bundle protein
MNNISEGFCRNTDSEFRHFLSISQGSGGEIKSMYYIAEDQKYLEQNVAAERREKIQKLINSIGTFMKYLKSGHSTKEHNKMQQKIAGPSYFPA